MKTKLFIIIILLALLPIYQVTFAQETDSTVSFGDWDLSYDVVLPAVVIKGSGEDNTQLVAKQFVGGGLGASVTYKKLKGLFGLNISILLYSGESKNVYPMLTGGPFLNLYKRRIALMPIWDFGKVDNNFNSGLKNRLGALLSVNISFSELFN